MRGPYGALTYRYIGPPGQPRVGGRRGARRPQCLLRGRRIGRRVEVHRRRHRWRPIFDEQAAQSIGAIAIAPSDPNIVWVGTGETFIRSNVSLGDGMYKSTDAGKTWTHMGLEQVRARRPHRHPPEATPTSCSPRRSATAYGPQQERGVYRTTDGGRTWQRVLFVDENTGASDLAMDPVNPEQRVRGDVADRHQDVGPRQRRARAAACSCRATAASRGSGSRADGLPEPPLGKIAVSVAPGDPESRLRAHRDGPARLALAQRRRRRALATW